MSKHRLAVAAIPVVASVLAVAAFASPAGASTMRLAFLSPARSSAYVGQPFTLAPDAVPVGFSADEPLTYSLSGRLPAGLRWTTADGQHELAGTATGGSTGAYHLVVRASLPGLVTARQLFVLTVSAGPPPDVTGAFALAQAMPSDVPVPVSVSYASGIGVSALGNDVLGDCLPAAEAHLEEAQFAAVHRPIRPVSTATVVRTYFALNGSQGGPTVGTYVDEALRSWESSGLGGERIATASQLSDPANRRAVEVAVEQLGGVLAVVEVPAFDDATFTVGTWGTRWLARNAQLAGTHAVAVVGYNRVGPLLSTWGNLQPVTWSWWQRYVQSAFAVLPQAFEAVGHGPSGLPVAQLLAAYGGQFAAPSITTSGATSVAAGEPVSLDFHASGYPLPTVTVSGQLPAGLSSAGGGAFVSIGGSTVTPGNYPLTVTATNGVGAPVSETIDLAVSPATPPAQASPPNPPVLAVEGSALTTQLLPGDRYDVTLPASGSTVTSWATEGSLPPGIRFTPEGSVAVVSGTVSLDTAGGSYVLTVTATNAGGSTSQTLLIDVLAVPTISAPASITATVGVPLSVPISATDDAYLSAANLPPGLTVANTGPGAAVITGTPTFAEGAGVGITATVDSSLASGTGTWSTVTIQFQVNP